MTSWTGKAYALHNAFSPVQFRLNWKRTVMTRRLTLLNWCMSGTKHVTAKESMSTKEYVIYKTFMNSSLNLWTGKICHLPQITSKVCQYKRMNHYCKASQLEWRFLPFPICQSTKDQCPHWQWRASLVTSPTWSSVVLDALRL